MFRKVKNIDTAFKQVKKVAIIAILSSFIISCLSILKSFSMVANLENRIYVLVGEKVIEAFASDRKQNLPVEIRDHVKVLHELFFTLDPDNAFIQERIGKAMYLGDASIKRVYDNLSEQGYYANIISGNISQVIKVDSINIDLKNTPYRFKCFATQKLTRTTSTVTRNLITTGSIRDVSRSDNNPHGFLVGKWKIIENNDLKIQNHKKNRQQ